MLIDTERITTWADIQPVNHEQSEPPDIQIAKARRDAAIEEWKRLDGIRDSWREETAEWDAADHDCVMAGEAINQAYRDLNALRQIQEANPQDEVLWLDGGQEAHDVRMSHD